MTLSCRAPSLGHSGRWHRYRLSGVFHRQHWRRTEMPGSGFAVTHDCSGRGAWPSFASVALLQRGNGGKSAPVHEPRLRCDVSRRPPCSMFLLVGEELRRSACCAPINSSAEAGRKNSRNPRRLVNNLTLLRRPAIGLGAGAAHQHCPLTVVQTASLQEGRHGLLVVDDRERAESSPCPTGSARNPKRRTRGRAGPRCPGRDTVAAIACRRR